MPGYYWFEREKEHDFAYQDLDKFFEELHDNADKNITGAKIAYRESQQRFASTVMDAIKSRKILLIEAGVGTGKTLGYLIPIFYTMNEVTVFDKVVISTSSIALQEQLMQDIEFVSKLLRINIKAWIAKGINNYACLKRIESKMLSASNHEDTKTFETLNEIKKTMLKGHICDINHLPNISNGLWKDIQVCGGCDKCKYRMRCAFIDNQAHVQNMPIVVTNHTQLCNMIKHRDSVVTNSSLFVIDEAHKLEEEFRLANEKTLNLNDLISRVEYIYYRLNYEERFNTTYETREMSNLKLSILNCSIELAKAIRSNVRSTFARQKNARSNIEDCDRLNFNIKNTRIVIALKDVIDCLTKAIRALRNIPIKMGYEQDIDYLNEYLNTIKDMALGTNSKNIYWVKFIDKERIEISFTPKDLNKTFKSLFGNQKPVVLTSATITTNGNYDHLKSSLNLEDSSNVDYENPIASPFNYEENTLFYYPNNIVVHPNTKDRNRYISDIANRVANLIIITEGKALVLFTSKRDMIDVYNLVKRMKLPQNLILQENKDITYYKEKFSDDKNACMFATGAFWEGVDIKGKSLSNLIIVRLPFPVQDPIVEYKKKGLSKKDAHKIDRDEMLLKLKQGTGRLIRSMSDTGIVCSLDARTKDYIDDIKASLPFTTYTTCLDDVLKFSQDKIIGEKEDSQPKTLKLEPKKDMN